MNSDMKNNNETIVIAIIAIVIFGLLGLTAGYEWAKMSVRSEAIENGHARYEVDSWANVKFVWNKQSK